MKIKTSEIKRLTLELNSTEVQELITPLEFIITDNRGTKELIELYEALIEMED